MKKFRKLICALVCVMLMGIVFAGCEGASGEGGGGKTSTFTFEAEYTKLDGIQGAATSGSAEGVNMIMGAGAADIAKGWSNGYYVGCTYLQGVTITFVFNSEVAETGKLSLRLGTEIGSMTLSSDIFGVTVNDKNLVYSGMFVSETSKNQPAFYDKPINESFDIKKGENIIKLIVKENVLNGGQQGGPLIDCIKVTSKAKLTWTPLLDNPDRKGEI